MKGDTKIMANGFVTVNTTVNGNAYTFKVQDGVAIRDKDNNRVLFKNGKFYKPDFDKGVVLHNTGGFFDAPSSAISSWHEFKEQPKIELTEADRQCLEAVMDNDNEAGLSIKDIDIARNQFREGQVKNDFGKHLTGYAVQKAGSHDGVSDNCLYVSLKSNQGKDYKRFNVDYAGGVNVTQKPKSKSDGTLLTLGTMIAGGILGKIKSGKLKNPHVLKTAGLAVAGAIAGWFVGQIIHSIKD